MPRGPKTKLTLKRYTSTADGKGGYTKTWAVVGNLTGVLHELSGGERFQALRKAVINTHKFYTDYRSDLAITEKDIFVLGTTTYEITGAGNDPMGQTRFSVYDLWEVNG